MRTVIRQGPWAISDIIDFEYYLAQDQAGGPDSVAPRDREIYQKQIEPVLPPEQIGDRRKVFLAWLNARRATDAHAKPGEIFHQGQRMLTTVLAVVGAIAGSTLATALLQYPEPEPINALLFFFLTVGVQLAFLAATLFLWASKRWFPGVFEWFRPSILLARRLIQWIMHGMTLLVRQLPGEQREKVRFAAAVLERKRDEYGALAFWPFLKVSQVFVLALNAGILLSMLLHIPIKDMRFGWQSTLNLGDGQVYAITSLIATPWKPFSSVSHPTQEQVRLSRYDHGQKAMELSADAAHAWWPFLAWAIIVYGLGLRLALFGAVTVMQNWALRRLKFDQAQCNSLFRRMRSQEIETAPTAELVIPEIKEHKVEAKTGGCVLLRSTEITVDDAELAPILKRRFGWNLEGSRPLEVDYSGGNEEALEYLRSQNAHLEGVVVLAPARRAPIRAIALVLQKVIDAAGNKPEVLIMLTGKRIDQGFETPPEDEVDHWRKFNAIHSLHLGLEIWKSL